MIESAQDMLEALETEIQNKVKVFALLGNEVRLKIVTLLLNVERLCVCDISDILKINQSPISQHLRKLKDAGLLENAREGITIYYKIPQEMRLILKQIVQGVSNV
jgi:DNA-binding transcriptional ArsR family regulator